MDSAKEISLEQIEQELLLEGIHRRYGYDFRDFAPDTLRRRIAVAIAQEGLSSISTLQDRLLRDPECMERFAVLLAAHENSMFRSPGFYLAVKREVAPILRTYPSIRVWVPLCSCGEEVYSVAIVLMECGIYDRCRIYATDFTQMALERARSGVFPSSSIALFRRNYARAGGEGDFSEYYTSGADHVVFRSWLIRNVTFGQHSLVSDASFNEFNLILCRNGLCDFNSSLRARVLRLFHDSLCRFGILGLGREDLLKNSPLETSYEQLPSRHRLYRRIN